MGASPSNRWWYRCPAGRQHGRPSTSGHRCQESHMCCTRWWTPKRPFGPCRGQQVWMRVHSGCRCSPWMHHRQACRSCPTPSTSDRRCPGRHRCGKIQQTQPRPIAPCQGRWMKVFGRDLLRHRCRSVPCRCGPSISARRYRGWRRYATFQQRPPWPFDRFLDQPTHRMAWRDLRPLRHYPTAHSHRHPSTSSRHCQEWHRYVGSQQTSCCSHKQRKRNSSCRNQRKHWRSPCN